MLRKTMLWLFLLLFIGGSQVKAQELYNDKIDVIAGSGQFLFNCVIYKPANFSTTKKYPLVLFFHGMGEAGTDVTKMYKAGLPKVLKDGYKPSFEFIMVAPQHNSYSLDPKHLEQVLNESILKFPNIDQSRVYLTGLSAGGNTIYVSSLNINKELPKRFAAMVVMSGATQGINKDNFPWWKEFKTPLWAVVGGNDPSYLGQNQLVVNEVNKQVPGLASLTVRAGVGHGGWNDVYNGSVKTTDGKTMWQWLYQFTRGGSTSTTPPPPAPGNTLPVANAGSDRTLTLPSNSVSLTGSGSDADGSISSYSWTKISGPTQYSLSSASVANPTLSNLVQGTYSFRLTVRDNIGATATDDVNIVVNGSTTPTPTPTGGRMVKVNLFGGSNTYSSSEWNNWNTNASRNSANFKYSDGTSSSIRAVLSAQNAVSDNSSSYSTTMIPKEVGRYTSYSTSNRTLTISGLDNAKTYTLELYASRNGISNNTTRFVIGSKTVDILTDNNLGNKAIFVSLTPSNGQIVLNISRLKTYNYLNGFTIIEEGGSYASTPPVSLPDPSTPPVASSDEAIKVNIFGGSNAFNDSEWNNWNTYASLSSSNFRYSDGSSSPVSAVLSGQSSISDNGSSYSINMAPEEVGRYASYSTSPRTLTIRGLDDSRTYEVELYASRKGISNNTTRFSVDGEYEDVKTDNNLSNEVVLEVTPENGKVIINLADLNTYNYINGFIIQ